MRVYVITQNDKHRSFNSSVTALQFKYNNTIFLLVQPNSVIKLDANNGLIAMILQLVKQSNLYPFSEKLDSFFGDKLLIPPLDKEPLNSLPPRPPKPWY